MPKPIVLLKVAGSFNSDYLDGTTALSFLRGATGIPRGRCAECMLMPAPTFKNHHELL
jgi:hypothetical protein